MKIYLSHPIRGHKGDNATQQDMDDNCALAVDFANFIRSMWNVDLYVPAEHDLFVQVAHRLGYIGIEGILTVDGEILRSCDAVIFYIPNGMRTTDSAGMEFEKLVAETNKVPWVEIDEPDFDRMEKAMQYLRSKVKA